MARKKKQDIYQVHRQQYWQEHNWAVPLREQYPGISAVTVELQFKDPDVWPGDPEPRTLTFTPDQKAYFHMQCPYRECVGGGFNFSEGVKEAINSTANEASGRVVCRGWQDEQRINKNSCLLAATYKVTVQR